MHCIALHVWCTTYLLHNNFSMHHHRQAPKIYEVVHFARFTVATASVLHIWRHASGWCSFLFLLSNSEVFGVLKNCFNTWGRCAWLQGSPLPP